MKKISKIILAAIFVILGALALTQKTSANFAAEDSAVKDSTNSAKTLFVRNCARCHGEDGKSQTELGETLEATDLTAKKTSVKRNVQVITNGVGGMPAFKKKLKSAEIRALANYVRSL
ncbi:MAG: c-type cytochrome [Pyrinomonadaceae bacterium]